MFAQAEDLLQRRRRSTAPGGEERLVSHLHYHVSKFLVLNFLVLLSLICWFLVFFLLVVPDLFSILSCWVFISWFRDGEADLLLQVDLR